MSVLDVIKFLVIISVLPTIVFMRNVYKKDKVEKEPISLIIKLFILGGFSIIVAGIGEFILDEIAQKTSIVNISIVYNLVMAFVIVAFVEETVKFLILKLFTWKNNDFNYTFDAVVYAVAVGLGFAAFENIAYVFAGGVLASILRAVTAIPAHMTFAILMGVYYGKAKVCEIKNDRIGKRNNLIKSLLIPILYHGIYDFCLFEGRVIFLIIFMVLLVGIYIILFRNLNEFSAEDRKINGNNDEENIYSKYMNEEDFEEYNDFDKFE